MSIPVLLQSASSGTFSITGSLFCDRGQAVTPMMVVHFHKATGRISAWGNGDSDKSHFPDHDIVRFADDAMANDPRRDKIDVESLLAHMVARDADGEMLDDLRAAKSLPRSPSCAATGSSYMVPDRPG